MADDEKYAGVFGGPGLHTIVTALLRPSRESVPVEVTFRVGQNSDELTDLTGILVSLESIFNATGDRDAIGAVRLVLSVRGGERYVIRCRYDAHGKFGGGLIERQAS